MPKVKAQKIEIGSTGTIVKYLQMILGAKGYRLNIDGQFGAKTLHAVLDFQKRCGLQPDGVVGPKTYSALRMDPPLEPVERPSVAPQESDAPWFDGPKGATSFLGQKEIPGHQDNPWIVRLFSYTTYRGKHDEVPWCAAFIAFILETNGYQSTSSAAAISNKHLGNPCEEREGAIIVLQHSNGRHHVTLFHHRVDAHTIACIGGNQGNKVSISLYNTVEHKIVAIRWPELRPA